MPTKMNPEVKAKWLAALRSGDYPQTTKFLRRVDAESKPIGYCCLGVLCEVHNKEVGGEWTEGHRYNGWGGILAESVVKWAGLPSQNPAVGPDDRGLPYYNDASGWSFAKIADFIEEHL